MLAMLKQRCPRGARGGGRGGRRGWRQTAPGRESYRPNSRGLSSKSFPYRRRATGPVSSKPSRAGGVALIRFFKGLRGYSAVFQALTEPSGTIGQPRAGARRCGSGETLRSIRVNSSSLIGRANRDLLKGLPQGFLALKLAIRRSVFDAARCQIILRENSIRPPIFLAKQNPIK